MPAEWDGVPRSWLVGETVTAALMNKELRNRMQYLYGEVDKPIVVDGDTVSANVWRTDEHIGGRHIYVQATTPTTPTPAVGDIWIDTSN